MIRFQCKYVLNSNRRFMARTGALLTIALLLQGCTSIETSPDLQRSDLSGLNGSNRTAIKGVPYTLPMLQYDVTFKYALTECNYPGPATPFTSASDDARQTALVQYTSDVLERDPEDQLVGEGDNTNDDDTPEKPIGDFKINVSAVATPSFKSGEQYTIDYDALSSFWKTSVFEIETHEETGTLKSINVSAEDKTAEAVSSAVKLALSAANIANPVRVQATQLNGQPLVIPDGTYTHTTKVVCTPEAAKAISDRKTAVTALAGLTKDLETEINTVELLKLTVKFQDPAAAVAEITAKVIAVQEAAEDVKLKQEELAKLNAALSVSVEHKWPEEFFEFNKIIDDQIKIERWISNPPGGAFLFDVLTVELDPPVKSDSEDVPGFGTDNVCGTYHAGSHPMPKPVVIDCLMDQMKTAIQLVETSATVDCSSSPRPDDQECLSKSPTPQIIAARNVKKDKGVFVRPPVAGALQICIASNSTAILDDDGSYLSIPCKDKLVLSEAAAIVPQLGQLRFLPFTNGLFENNALAVELGQKGQVNKFSYKKTSAQAASLLGAAADAAKQYETYQKERAEAELKAIQTARTEGAAQRAEQVALVDYEIAMLEKEKKLLELQNPNTVSAAIAEETASLQAEIALLKARKELLELQQQANN